MRPLVTQRLCPSLMDQRLRGFDHTALKVNGQMMKVVNHPLVEVA